MDTYLEQLNELIPIHRQVADFNLALRQLYPVAVAADHRFYLYDRDAGQARYHFIQTSPLPMPIPAGTRAAFQLKDLGGRIACVVTPEIFETLEGYITILHEFVHCYQYETCEQALKGSLDIARQAQEKGDFMWEIQHPFPYKAGTFIRGYCQFVDAVCGGDDLAIYQARRALRDYLGLHDFEYMLWQEWKEGFARWVENNLQRILGVKINTGGLVPPFNRVTFYAGGAAWIDFLHKGNPEVVNDLRSLFARMSSPDPEN